MVAAQQWQKHEAVEWSSENQDRVVSNNCVLGTSISEKLVLIRTFLSRDFNQLTRKCFSITVITLF